MRPYLSVCRQRMTPHGRLRLRPRGAEMPDIDWGLINALGDGVRRSIRLLAISLVSTANGKGRSLTCRATARSRGPHTASPQTTGWRRHWPIAVMIVLVALAWAPCVYPSKDRTERAVLSWKVGADFCETDVNTRPFLRYREKFEVVATCVLIDPTIDNFENTLISTSKPFPIRGDKITMAYPFSDELKARIRPGQQVTFFAQSGIASNGG
jgi:hypothetical protein